MDDCTGFRDNYLIECYTVRDSTKQANPFFLEDKKDT